MPINALDMVLDIVYVIIVPIVLGLIVRRVMPVIVDKSIRVVPLISVAAIIIIVTAVVAGNVDTLAASGVLMFFAVILDRKSTRLNSSHVAISYAVFCL